MQFDVILLMKYNLRSDYVIDSILFGLSIINWMLNIGVYAIVSLDFTQLQTIYTFIYRLRL